jgi:bifunctional DNA-binding transcriptional regulator/antitoxin component of YhaV-PrlF toxin-antitoxin module
MNDLINCGERRIQKLFRITLSDICERYGIHEGDAVEVFIRKTDKK